MPQLARGDVGALEPRGRLPVNPGAGFPVAPQGRVCEARAVAQGETEMVDGRVRRAAALRRERRAQILAAARRVFAREGYHGASIKGLLDEAGVARGTFYAHFDSKQAAFREVLFEFVERLTAVLKPVDIQAATSPYDQLLGNVTRALGLFDEDPAFARLLFHQAQGVSEEVRGHIEAFYGRVTALLTRSLDTGTRVGMVRPGDNRLRAAFILGALKEMAAGWEGTQDLSQREASARALLDFVLEGLFPRG